jgi:uncharacterized protein YbjT (DUF2867 family)
MQILIAGASGFIGSNVVQQALAEGHEVFPLVRMESSSAFDEEAQRSGKLTVLPYGADAEVLMRGFGVEPGALLINAAGVVRERPGFEPRVHREIAEHLLALADDLEVMRWVHLSPLLNALDAFTESKREAEQILMKTKRPWSILRAAPVFGAGDSLLDEVGAWMHRSPFIPRFLEAVLLQPLHVEDLAQALLAVQGQGTHEIGGELLSWGQLLQACAQAAGKALSGPHISDATALRFARWFGKGRFGSDLVPFTEDGYRRHGMGYQVDENALPALLNGPSRKLNDYLSSEWSYRV